VFKPCAIVPVYNHGLTVGRVATELRAFGLDVILVDDASNSECAAELDRLSAADDHIAVRRHPVNRGKGAAVMTGLRAAQDAGFTHAVQIDADCQHTFADVPRLVEAARGYPTELICGRPIFGPDIPRVRFYGRYFCHTFVWLETLSFDIPDSMCGLRLYPLAPVLDLMKSERLGSRMDFDTEILVRLNWRNVRMRWVPTKVVYPDNGVSHYRYVRDNALLINLHVRLLLGMLFRLPMLIKRNVERFAKAARATP
jgi:glycosyltransferase involved in cell wall biosynthesis